METSTRSENGITSAVKTIFSSYRLIDIIDQVTLTKGNAITDWLTATGPMPGKCLILGAYLTGAGIANVLSKTASVTVLDKCSFLQGLLDPAISFVTTIDDVPACEWDLIMDTTGIGGIDPGVLDKFGTPAVFLAENPCSDESDSTIVRVNQCYMLINRVAAPRKGILLTEGLRTKTSGTMTILMEILRRSMEDAVRLEGVLYSTATCDHYERILFQDKDYPAFVDALKKPALIVSSLSPVNCDVILQKHIAAVSSKIIDFYECLL